MLRYDNASSLFYYLHKNTSNQYTELQLTYSLTVGTWYKYDVAVKTSATAEGNVYINGANQTLGTKILYAGAIADYANDFRIGANSTPTPQWIMDGIVDNLTISNQQRSSGWLSTEYNSQSSPSTFITEGTPETPSSGSAATAGFLFLMI
jgi:hypothetical protein